MSLTLYAKSNIPDEKEYFQNEWIVFHIDGNGDANTGDWMGWINVIHAPYVWSYSLTNWMYVDEYSVSELGMWAYVISQ